MVPARESCCQNSDSHKCAEVAIFRGPHTWVDLRRSIAQAYLAQALEQAAATPGEDHTEDLRKSQQDIAENKISSRTFSRLLAFSKYEPRTDASDPWYSFDLIIEVYIPAIILLIAAGLTPFLIVQYRKKERRRSSTARRLSLKNRANR
jgi:hypothetical protein